MKEELLLKEIETLKKSSKIFMNTTLKQYKKVLKLLEDLEKERNLLEEKVKIRTKHLQNEIEYNMELTKRLEKLANYDPLTNLLNRRKLIEQVKLLEKNKFTILFIDLDGFKPINDIYGHKIGDEVLKVVSKRLLNSTRSTDLVARFGGDEFIVVLVDLIDEKKAFEIANNILDKINKEIVIKDKKVKVGASIGLYISKEDKIENALKKADMAMYKSKESGKNRVLIYSEDIEKIKNIIKDIKSNKLELKLNPIINSQTEEICAFRGYFDIDESILDANIIEELNLYKIEKLKSLDIKEKIYFAFPLSMINEINVDKLLNLNIIGCIGFDSFKFSKYQSELLTKLKQKYKLGLNIFDNYSIKPFIDTPIKVLRIEEETFLKAPKFFQKFFIDLEILDVKVIIKSEKIYCKNSNIFYEI